MPKRIALLAKVTLGILVLVAFGATTAAAARLAPITGHLSQRGYTVLALAAGGEATSVVAKHGKFTLRPPAEHVTLQLRAPDGAYAGPVVVGSRQKGKRAIVGVLAGAHLGKIIVKPDQGYAKVAKRPPKGSADTKRVARAKKGVPIGAANFGRVRVAKLTGPSSDRDLDGIPTSLDVDNDGDLILNDVDRHTAGSASAAQAQQQAYRPFDAFSGTGGQTFDALSGLILPAGPGRPESPVVNANAPGLTEQQIEAALPAQGTLQMGIEQDFGNDPYVSAELDCGTLVYCSAGGTGKYDKGGDPGVLDLNPQPFPECCDSDGDGLGSLGGSGKLSLMLQTGATADQIRAGDLLIIRAKTASGGQQEIPGTLKTIPATVPALASYTDELGTEHVISYPIDPSWRGYLRAVDGPDPGSDVSVKLTFWRPQRRPLPDEVVAGAGKWIDIGGLLYIAGLGVHWCPQSSYSDVQQGLTLTNYPLYPGPSGSVPLLIDSARDQPASPSNTFSYTLNLSQCAAFRGSSFDPGQGLKLLFQGSFPPKEGQPFNSVSSVYSFTNLPQPPAG